MAATTIASSILACAEADNFMKVANAKMSAGKASGGVSAVNQNSLKDTSIFAMKPF